MLETSELVCLNTLYIACAILCSKISRFFKQPSTHELKGNRKQSQIKAGLEIVGECVFIVWNSLYIATLLCVLWKFIYQSQFANINYLCSWFVLFQLVFYCLFLLSYVAFMDGICRFINDIFFPVINSLCNLHSLSVTRERLCGISRHWVLCCSYSSCSCCIILRDLDLYAQRDQQATNSVDHVLSRVVFNFVCS